MEKEKNLNGRFDQLRSVMKVCRNAVPVKDFVRHLKGTI